MWETHISIKTTLFVFISTLNVLIALLVGFNVYKAWNSYHEVQGLLQSLDANNLFYKSEKSLSLERGVASSILYVTDDVAEVLYPKLLENRAQANDYLQAALSAVEQREKGEQAEQDRENVREKLEDLENVRKEMDAALNDPEGVYDRGVITGNYFQATTALALAIGDYVALYSAPVMDIDPLVSQQMLYKQMVWQITEFAGQEYAEIGWLIASNRYPSEEMRGRYHNRRGHIERGWRVVRMLAETSHAGDVLAPYMDEAETHYFLTFDQIKRMFFAPGVKDMDTPYPITIELWLEKASQATDMLLQMQDAAIVHNRSYVHSMEDQAWEDMLLSLLMFACALVLSFYSWNIIVNRIIRPVDGMVEALYHAIHGEDYQLPDVRQQYDEIGKLGRILEVFQYKTKEWEDRKNYLRTILATMMDAIIAINAKGKIQMINPSAEKMFGYTESELLGEDMTLLMPEEMREKHKAGMDRYLETGVAKVMGTTQEFEALHRDGTVFPVEVSITETQEAGHKIFVGVMRDITQRKAAEEKIGRYLADLERSNQELDDFAYIASHDLKEPLRGLHNFSRFLIEDYEDRLDEDGKNMLETISELTQRMEAQLNALLHYSRLGRTELSIQKTDLNQLVEEVVKMFAITVKQNGAEISVVRELPTIVCDHVRVKEVFQNLIGNALKYNENEKAQIEIGYVEDHPSRKGEAVYYVRDNGIGIDKRHIDSVFKIFRRLHPRHAYGGGTGSGLTIVKKIINQHNGEIWVESEGVGKGCTFYFTLPSQKLAKA